MVVAPQLRRIRNQRSLTQQELADKAHVDRATVSRAERGFGVRAPILRKLARALGVSPATLQRSD